MCIRDRKRLKLINWHNFENVTFDCARLTYMIGVNAVGKTTILDAIRYCLTTNRNFNALGNKKSGRTLQGSVHAKQRGENAYRRPGRTVAYIGAEFWDSVKRTHFVIAVRVESEGPMQELHPGDQTWYISEDGCTLEQLPFIDPRTGAPSSKENFKPAVGRLSYTRSPGEARDRICRALGIGRAASPLGKKFNEVFQMGTSMDEIPNFREFLYQYILPQPELDLEALQGDRVELENLHAVLAEAQTRAAALADKLVPYSLLGTAVTYALTRNATRAISILMVDFSCALKLSMPLAVLSAMRECGSYHITVKGGKYLEALAKADTIVFDKTGTLTRATPQVVQVVPFSGCGEQEVLQLAACLEEHFPHSMANAVVAEAKRHGLTHEEYHSQVQYVVAHGISSMVEGKKVIIGSAHFVFEDEGCRIPEGEQAKFDTLPAAYSHLYLCMDGELAAVICIHDPLRREAREAVRALHESGFTNVVMMTGDNRRTAETVAAEVGVDAVYAEVLPEDKAAFIRQEKAKGHTVIMVGDGVNDSPALSEADAGIAISTGAAIAREIADITVASEDLFALVTLRRLGEALMERIHGSYRFIVGFNLTLIALGVAGVLPPTTSALLHNGSTLGISLRNMTDLLDDEENPRK